MKPKLLIILLSVSLILVLIGVLIESPTSTPYSIFNTYTNGYSILAEKFSLKPLFNISSQEFMSPNDTVIIIPLLHSLENNTLWKLKNFVEKGGVVIVLDENGYINEFLNFYLNVPIWITNATIYDEIINYRGNRSLPSVNVIFEDRSLTCYLYKPLSIGINEKLSETKIIIHGLSSPYSYRDNDGNGYFSVGDEFGSQPVIVEIKTGDGSIYVVSDMDLFTNKYIKMGDNEELASFLIGSRNMRYIYMGGINASLIDYIKAFLYRYGKGMDYEARVFIEFIALIVLAMVVYYGEKTGLWR